MDHPCSCDPLVLRTRRFVPFKLTHDEFQLGRADWSLSSMTVSGRTSWMMLVERDRLRCLVSLMSMLLFEVVRTREPGTDIFPTEGRNGRL